MQKENERGRKEKKIESSNKQAMISLQGMVELLKCVWILCGYCSMDKYLAMT